MATFYDTIGDDTITADFLSAGVTVDSDVPGTTDQADTVNLTSGDDMVATGRGDDTVNVGAGGDFKDISTQQGADTVTVAAGVSLSGMFIEAGNRDDDVTLGDGVSIGSLGFSYFGGTGTDRLIFEGAVTATFFTLADVEIIYPAATSSLVGTSGKDFFDFGGASVDTFASAFSVYAGGGDDDIYGGNGGDNIFGEDGSDLIDGGFGNDTIDGGAGEDLIFGGGGADSIDGGDDNDIIYGGGGADSIDGGKGNDLIILEGKSWNNKLDGGVGDDTLSLQDDIKINPNFEIQAIEFFDTNGFSLIGSNYAGETFDFRLITMVGDGLEFLGNAGDDNVIGSVSGDFFDGGADNDALDGFKGNDTLDGGLGDDTITGGKDDDLIIGGEGNDSIIVGDQIDTLIFNTTTDDDDIISGYGFNNTRVQLETSALVNDIIAAARSGGAKWGLEDGDTFGDVNVYASGSDLVVDFTSGGSLTFENTTIVLSEDFITAGIA